jgi:hypothetical protein
MLVLVLVVATTTSSTSSSSTGVVSQYNKLKPGLYSCNPPRSSSQRGKQEYEYSSVLETNTPMALPLLRISVWSWWAKGHQQAVGPGRQLLVVLATVVATSSSSTLL